ncbi:MAG: glutaredoxin family protein [Thermomicrobiales bacterium]
MATIYTQNGCAQSLKVRDWLVGQGIEFVERNVTSDLDAARDLFATGTFATPLLVVGNAQVLGFRPDELTAVLQRTANE